jgi:hypothetical protein
LGKARFRTGSEGKKRQHVIAEIVRDFPTGAAELFLLGFGHHGMAGNENGFIAFLISLRFGVLSETGVSGLT